MLKETLKRNKGITLIALVVTIIVLLILAGISINMLTGQNGILNRAAEAKEKTGVAQTEETVKLSVTDALTRGTGSLTDENLKDRKDVLYYPEFRDKDSVGNIIDNRKFYKDGVLVAKINELA